MSNQFRVEAGVPAGGQFATAVKSDPAVSLGDEVRSRVAIRADRLETEAYEKASALYEANPDAAESIDKLRELLDRGCASLSAGRAALVSAELMTIALEDDEHGEDLAADIDYRQPQMLLGVNIDDHGEWEDGDLPGDSDQYGYDWRAIAGEVTERYRESAAELAKTVAQSEIYGD